MNSDMKLYYDYTISPLGKFFYKSLFKQLEQIKGKKILDFGSGFAFTTNFLAQNNDVTALEVDDSMIKYSEKACAYTQIHGGLEEVKKMGDNTFDVITCHLVLEFVENPNEILNELVRVLKKGGTLSIVRHNKNGRIIQAIVQDYDIEDAHHLLDGGVSFSSAFGNINYYTNEDIINSMSDMLTVDSINGIRVLASLHSQTMQNTNDWVEKMLEIECKLLENKDFINIAYFNHIVFTKN